MWNVVEKWWKFLNWSFVSESVHLSVSCSKLYSNWTSCKYDKYCNLITIDDSIYKMIILFYPQSNFKSSLIHWIGTGIREYFFVDIYIWISRGIYIQFKITIDCIEFQGSESLKLTVWNILYWIVFVYQSIFDVSFELKYIVKIKKCILLFEWIDY